MGPSVRIGYKKVPQILVLPPLLGALWETIFVTFRQSGRSDNFLAVTSMASHRISDARFVLIRSWDTTGQLGADRHGVVHVLLLKWPPRL